MTRKQCIHWFFCCWSYE